MYLLSISWPNPATNCATHCKEAACLWRPITLQTAINVNLRILTTLEDNYGEMLRLWHHWSPFWMVFTHNWIYSPLLGLGVWDLKDYMVPGHKAAGMPFPFIQWAFIAYLILCQASIIWRWIGHGLCLQGAQSVVEDLRTAIRRNLCRVLKGFMVISQGRRMVSSIPDRKQQGQRHRSKKQLGGYVRHVSGILESFK